MKLAIDSLMLLAASTVIALPTPEQATSDSCIGAKNEANGTIEKRFHFGSVKGHIGHTLRLLLGSLD